MTATNFETVQKLAAELADSFERRTRTNGDEFTCLKDGAPQWMTDVIHATHGDKLPDDHIYQFCEWAADAIAEADADEDSINEAICEIEPPYQTFRQMKWFSENWEYCDEAIREGLWQSQDRNRDSSVTDLVAIGMQMHIREIGQSLLSALTDRADEIE